MISYLDLTGNAEYVSPGQPVQGDLFGDPEEVSAVLSLVRDLEGNGR